MVALGSHLAVSNPQRVSGAARVVVSSVHKSYGGEHELNKSMLAGSAVGVTYGTFDSTEISFDSTDHTFDEAEES